jgi:amino acid transporter
MGDEIRDPARTLPGAVAWGGVISGALYIGTTLTLLIAIGKNDISVLQGIVQAVGQMAERVNIAWISVPFAVMLSISIAGIGSAWMGGSARIPFVAGLDSYMPSWLGKVHPKYLTPHAALIVQAIVSASLVLFNFAGFWLWNRLVISPPIIYVVQLLQGNYLRLLISEESVQGVFQRLLSLAVVLQLVPFLYMFAALVKFGWTADTSGRYGRATLLISGLAGFVTTFLGIALVFFPAQQVASLVSYEIWMFGGTTFFIALAAFFFFVYGRRKAQRQIVDGATGVPAPPPSAAR